MKLKDLIACAASSALLVSLASCGQQQTTRPIDHPSSAQPSQGPAVAGGRAPDGTELPGGARWLSTLPDPRKVDRAAAVAVARAYETTLRTWDTTTDRDSNSGYMRSSIYGDPAYRDAIASQADRPATGDELFVNARPHRSYTTVSISHAGSDGVSADADSSSITVAWRQSIIARDESGNDTRNGVDYVQLKRVGGVWSVSGMIISTKGAES